MDAAAVVMRFYDALNAHDANAVVASLKPGGTWNCPAVPKTSLSGDQIASFVQSMIAAFPDMKFEVGSIERTNGRKGTFLDEPGPDVLMAAVWLMNGTHTGVFQGMAPTGRRVDLLGADLFRVEGEQLSCLDGIWDSASLRLQIES